MQLTRITPIVEKTAKELNIPTNIVAAVIKHLFDYIKEYFLFPTYTGIRLRYWGVIRPNLSTVRLWLKNGVKRLRRNPDQPKLRERFPYFWKLRHIVKEDNERRNFKKRFGSWHWKAASTNKQD